MEDFRLDLTMGANRGARCKTINLPKFTLIGATTKLASISAPLRDRFGISQKLEYYTIDELKKIIFNFARLIKLDLDDEASIAILKEDLSCSWPINSFKVRGRAKLRLLFLFSSGIIFESTILSSFLRLSLIHI